MTTAVCSVKERAFIQLFGLKNESAYWGIGSVTAHDGTLMAGLGEKVLLVHSDLGTRAPLCAYHQLGISFSQVTWQL